MSKLLTGLLIGAIFFFLVGPALFFKQYWLAAVFFVFGLCFGLIEWASTSFSGLSVSQHFWVLRDANYGQALTIAICMVVAWTCLIVHFMVKF